jgi:steroid 5-alpha reductase family enzyme
VGVFVGCAGAFTSRAHYATVASPLFVMLLLRYVSGVPIQAKQAQQRWGHTAEYQEYVRSTNLLLPLPKLKAKE